MKFENKSGSATLHIPDSSLVVPCLDIEDAAGTHTYTFASPSQLKNVITHLTTLLGEIHGQTPSPEDIMKKMHSDNAFELRMWKEGFSEGYGKGFDSGREYQLEQ